MSRFQSTSALISHIVLLGLGVVVGLAAAAWLVPAHGLAIAANSAADAQPGKAAPIEKRASEDEPPPSEESPQQLLERKLREWNLDPDQIRRELDRAGRVIREKGREAGEYVRDEWPDVKTMAVIKGRYILDRELNAWDITVGSKDGHVTLSGWVDSADQISRAIVIALETDDVLDVSSTLKVRPKGETS